MIIIPYSHDHILWRNTHVGHTCGQRAVPKPDVPKIALLGGAVRVLVPGEHHIGKISRDVLAHWYTIGHPAITSIRTEGLDTIVRLGPRNLEKMAAIVGGEKIVVLETDTVHLAKTRNTNLKLKYSIDRYGLA